MTKAEIHRTYELMTTLNIFFDVDYTILAVNGSLRPRTKETFRQLANDGHNVHVWSGVGIRTRELKIHGLHDHVAGVYRKPLEDFETGLTTFGVPVRPDFVIDDYPQIVNAFGGIVVTPYYFPNRDDGEMDLIYHIITEFAEKGHSDHDLFRPAR
jgi:hypothetical protein